MSSEKKNKKSTKNDSLKKNKSSYMFFCIDERTNIKLDKPELNNKEVVVELGLRWTNTKQNEPERLKYFEKLASEDKERYIAEKQNLTSSVSTDTVIPEKEQKKNKKSNAKSVSADTDVTNVIVTNSEEPKKTKINGYINFCKKMRETVKKNNPDIAPKDIQKELGRLWKDLTDAEKEEYKNE